MAQRSNQNQERDEYGRFANDDDRYSRGTNGGQNRGGNGNGRGQSFYVTSFGLVGTKHLIVCWFYPDRPRWNTCER